MNRQLKTYEDIVALKDNQIAESTTLDYKQAMYALTNESSKNEMLKDICAFANTQGGQLVIGVKEKKGKGTPETIDGISIPDKDSLERQIHGILNSQVEPRVNVHIEFIPVNGHADQYFLVLNVSQSWNAPHRPLQGSVKKFHIRHGTRNDEMSYTELRDKFMMMSTLKDNIRTFRNKRIMEIKAGDTPVPVFAGGLFVLHIIPFSAFSSILECNIQDLVKRAQENYAQPFGVKDYSHNYGINLDGIASYPLSSDEPNRAYTQFYCNGIIEAVAQCTVKEDQCDFVSLKFQDYLLKQQYFNLLQELQFFPPYVVFISFINIKQHYLKRGDFFEADDKQYHKEDILLNECIVEDIPQDIRDIFRPLFNKIWNAWGYPYCQSIPQISNDDKME